MKISFILSFIFALSVAASSDQLFELEKKHLENQKKLVELSSNIALTHSKITENTDFLSQKTEQMARRMFALNSLKHQKWGVLLFNNNLKDLQKNLTILKTINSYDTQIIADYRYAQNILVKQKLTLENKRNELLQTDKLIAEQQKEIQSLEVTEMDFLKRQNSNSLLLKKGQLQQPITGAIKNSYGSKQDDLNQFSYFISGLYFLTQPLASVRPVSAGKVIFADKIPHRGLSVIVEHPGKYFSVYTNLDTLSTAVDKDVDTDVVLGQASNDDFYFELRHKNISIDPKNWLKTESKGQL